MEAVEQKMEEHAAKGINREEIKRFKDENTKTCGEAINTLLQQYDCRIVARPFITEQGTISAGIVLESN